MAAAQTEALIYLFVIHRGSVSMKALLCVLTQFLKMGGLDYKQSQEIMLARLELRGCDSLSEPHRKLALQQLF